MSGDANYRAQTQKEFKWLQSPQRAQRSKKFEISSEIENFEREWHFRASHPPRPYFLWGNRDVEIEIFELKDQTFRSRLKISIEIKFFWSLGPLGSTCFSLCENVSVFDRAHACLVVLHTKGCVSALCIPSGSPLLRTPFWELFSEGGSFCEVSVLLPWAPETH